MVRARPRVLIVQHVAEEGPGRLVGVLAAHGVDFDVVPPNGEMPLGMFDRYDGLVVLGGPMAANDLDAFPRLRDELEALRAAVAHRLPTLGICLGSQLLAAAAGAAVYRAARLEVGWHAVTLTPGAARDPLFGGLESPFAALHWHGDIFELPDGACALAHSEQTALQAFVLAQAWGLLFHLEAGADEVGAMAEAFPDDVSNTGNSAAGLSERAVANAEQLEGIANHVFGNWSGLVSRRFEESRDASSR